MYIYLGVKSGNHLDERRIEARAARVPVRPSVLPRSNSIVIAYSTLFSIRNVMNIHSKAPLSLDLTGTGLTYFVIFKAKNLD